MTDFFEEMAAKKRAAEVRQLAAVQRRECCKSVRGEDHDLNCEIYSAETEEREPTDDEIYNRHGVEGGIGYSTTDLRDDNDV